MPAPPPAPQEHALGLCAPHARTRGAWWGGERKKSRAPPLSRGGRPRANRRGVFFVTTTTRVEIPFCADIYVHKEKKTGGSTHRKPHPSALVCLSLSPPFFSCAFFFLVFFTHGGKRARTHTHVHLGEKEKREEEEKNPLFFTHHPRETRAARSSPAAAAPASPAAGRPPGRPPRRSPPPPPQTGGRRGRRPQRR